MLVTTMLLLFVASCTSRKKLVSPMARVADYQWMNAKMNGELETNNGAYSFTGSLRIHRDSTVWISVSAFMGMESVRALITQDSVIVLNRIDQTYLAEPKEVLQNTGMMPAPSVQEIQFLLLGNGSSDRVLIQWGPYVAKIRYSDIHWDEPQTFPIKINKKYERVKL